MLRYHLLVAELFLCNGHQSIAIIGNAEEILEDCLKLYTSLTPGLAGFLSKFVVWVEIRVSRKSGGKKKSKISICGCKFIYKKCTYSNNGTQTNANSKNACKDNIAMIVHNQ